MAGSVWVVQTTLPGDWIEPLAGQWCATLVESELAACVQRNRVTSVFRWEGSIESSEEWRIQIKTSESRKDGLIALILKEHPYETPQITAWKAESSDGYADWVEG
tara:strand:- start:1079 stop:1393 length:315 start_codon:yes stop_codon:yes gene_type:complete